MAQLLPVLVPAYLCSPVITMLGSLERNFQSFFLEFQAPGHFPNHQSSQTRRIREGHASLPDLFSVLSLSVFVSISLSLSLCHLASSLVPKPTVVFLILRTEKRRDPLQAHREALLHTDQADTPPAPSAQRLSLHPSLLLS